MVILSYLILIDAQKYQHSILGVVILAVLVLYDTSRPAASGPNITTLRDKSTPVPLDFDRSDGSVNERQWRWRRRRLLARQLRTMRGLHVFLHVAAVVLTAPSLHHIHILNAHTLRTMVAHSTALRESQRRRPRKACVTF